MPKSYQELDEDYQNSRRECDRLKSAKARLIELLSQCSEYLDRGDYPENKTQYRLFRRCEQALKDSEL